MLRLARQQWSYRLRGIIYGAILTMLGVIAVGLCFAAARGEQPFRRGKLIPHYSMDIAVKIVVPVAVPLGALVGFALAELRWKLRRTNS